MSDAARLLEALEFSARKHRDQRRKDEQSSPYINHPIQVASVLASVGGVSDVELLMAAVLHDTVEDTETTPEELEARFGPSVRALVEEVSDDGGLRRAERQRIQEESVRNLSPWAQLIRIADKICNVRDLRVAPPAGWTRERSLHYLDWTERVVNGCRGRSAPLEALFDEVLAASRAAVRSPDWGR